MRNYPAAGNARDHRSRGTGVVGPAPPRDGVSFEEALKTVADIVYPLSRHNGHPRFFGYVASPGTPVSAVGDLLTAGLNANVTSWRSAPAAAALEHVVIDWLKAMLGYAPGAAGLLVSGGSMANFSALAAARTAKRRSSGGRAFRPRKRYACMYRRRGTFLFTRRPGY